MWGPPLRFIVRTSKHDITLFKAITMFCGTDSKLHNIPHIQSECEGIFRIILSVRHNIVMNYLHV